MKKNIIIITIFLCTILFFSQSIKANTNQKTLVILGDSIAYGQAGIVNPAIPLLAGGRNYAAIIEQTKGWEVINRARNSGRTRGVIDRDMIELLTLETTLAQATQNDVKRADIINISIGGNDLQGINNTNQGGFSFGPNYLRETIEEALAYLNDDITETPVIDYLIAYLMFNVEEIINAIRELNSEALIVWFSNYVPPYHAANGMFALAVNNMFGTSSVQDAYDAAVFVIDRMNQGYQDFIEANPGAFIISDANTAFNGNPRYYNGGDHSALTSDIIHPNALGHALLAAILMETINSYFAERLISENNRLEAERKALEAEKAALEAERNALENERNQLETDNAALENERNLLENENESLNNDLYSANNSRNRLRTIIIIESVIIGFGVLTIGTLVLLKKKK
ncbi:MAG: GDSL-type esterase/lipase family protein [Erysipelotrichales bacterium]|nr:GDSL-type esterase/lipase family protein [Erysipelotrichales bacterium]